MLYTNHTDFIADLERAGELVRIREEVDPYLEIACITVEACKLPPDRNKALLFEKVKGRSIPVLTNTFGSARRLNMMAGTADYAAMTAKLADFLELLQAPRRTIVDKLAALPLLRDVQRCFPKYVKRAPCHQQIMLGDAVDLTRLPILTTWPLDGGPFVTLPLVFTKDPIDGKRNCGMYRLQVYDRQTTGFHVATHHTGADHLRKAAAMGQDRLEVAIAIGAEPAATFAATVPLPPGMDEMIFAGFLNEAPVRMVRCKTVDLEVPASSEIVLEGYVKVDEMRREGPFGDHTGFYSLADDYGVFHCTCITTRNDPVYQATVVGPPPQEDNHIIEAIERLFLPLMRQTLPEIEDYSLPFEGVAHNLMLAKIRKDYPGQGRKVAHAVWGLGQAMFTKVICVGDQLAPEIKDGAGWARKMARELDLDRDLEMVRGPIETLDHASRSLHYGSKVMLDLTRVFDGEGTRTAAPAAGGEPDTAELLARLREQVPEVDDLALPFSGDASHLMLVTLDKSAGTDAHEPQPEPGVRDTAALNGVRARRVIEAAWEVFDELPCAQRIVVFDRGEDLDDHRRLVWLGLNNIDPERDLVFDEVVDPEAGPARRHPRRIGVDCTTKSRADGFTRDWPVEQTYPDQLIKSINQKWDKLGLGARL